MVCIAGPTLLWMQLLQIKREPAPKDVDPLAWFCHRIMPVCCVLELFYILSLWSDEHAARILRSLFADLNTATLITTLSIIVYLILRSLVRSCLCLLVVLCSSHPPSCCVVVAVVVVLQSYALLMEPSIWLKRFFIFYCILSYIVAVTGNIVFVVIGRNWPFGIYYAFISFSMVSASLDRGCNRGCNQGLKRVFAVFLLSAVQVAFGMLLVLCKFFAATGRGSSSLFGCCVHSYCRHPSADAPACRGSQAEQRQHGAAARGRRAARQRQLQRLLRLARTLAELAGLARQPAQRGHRSIAPHARAAAQTGQLSRHCAPHRQSARRRRHHGR
jgi:hypothetical protein